MQCRRPGFDPWVRKIPWRREWLPTPVFWPGEFHGQRRLAGYSPWGHKGSDMAELPTHMRLPKLASGRQERYRERQGLESGDGGTALHR